MRPLLKLLMLVTLPLALVGCDHATKQLATRHLRGHAHIEVIPRVLQLAYTENRDVGFSALRFVPPRVRKPLILVMGAGVLVLLGLLWHHRRAAPPLEHVAFALLAAGGLGNVLDRLLRGYVVDFVHVRGWPVFNMADVWLVTGGLLMAVATRRSLARR
jgi:signal peptidase II